MASDDSIGTFDSHSPIAPRAACIEVVLNP